MEQAIVITSIQPPTKAIKEYANKPNVEVIVVADKKSPVDWTSGGVKLISVEEQLALPYPIIKYLPWNHYSRKMIGYLYAIHHSASIIYDTDDDNLPKENWKVPVFFGSNYVTRENCEFVNAYQHFTDENIWPRGFPLALIKNNYKGIFSEAELQEVNVSIWQGMADLDPDVDAIYRLLINKPCFFTPNSPIVLGKGTVCPFNTQNTFFHQQAFPLLYIPATVTFRFCDILRGLIAQPILWSKNLHVGFTEATVVQERNPHDYMKDFISEIPMYVNAEKIISLLAGKIKSNLTIAENLIIAYEALLVNDIVKKEEMKLVDAWLESLEFKH